MSLRNHLIGTLCLALLHSSASFAQERPVVKPPSAEVAPAAPAVAGFKLPDGTPIKLKLARDLSSATEQKDARVDFEVAEEVKLDGVVVAPRGSVALGRVTDAQPKRRMGRTGKLAIGLETLQLASGEKARLRAVQTAPDGSRVGTVTTAVVAAGIVFFPAAPLFLLMKGKDIFIPKGTAVTAYVDGDVPLDRAQFAPLPNAADEPATVQLRVTQEGAEITLDGKFAGTAPAALRLAPGEHIILIRKSGFKDWQRTLTVTGGSSLNLEAQLERIEEKQ